MSNVKKTIVEGYKIASDAALKVWRGLWWLLRFIFSTVLSYSSYQFVATILVAANVLCQWQDRHLEAC